MRVSTRVAYTNEAHSKQLPWFDFHGTHTHTITDAMLWGRFLNGDVIFNTFYRHINKHKLVRTKGYCVDLFIPVKSKYQVVDGSMKPVDSHPFSCSMGWIIIICIQFSVHVLAVWWCYFSSIPCHPLGSSWYHGDDRYDGQRSDRPEWEKGKYGLRMYNKIIKFIYRPNEPIPDKAVQMGMKMYNKTLKQLKNYITHYD